MWQNNYIGSFNAGGFDGTPACLMEICNSLGFVSYLIQVFDPWYVTCVIKYLLAKHICLLGCWLDSLIGIHVCLFGDHIYSLDFFGSTVANF